jgi:hypothetical protein
MIVTLGGKMLKIFMPAYNVLFWKKNGWRLVYEGDDYSSY